MPTTLVQKKIVDRAQWEPCYPLPVANVAGSFMKAMRIPAYNLNLAAATAGVSAFYAYDATNDGTMLLPASGLAGTFGAGTSGCLHPMGPSGTATAGSTTTVTTNLTILKDLRGFTIRITGGPGAGDERIILSNTTGANAIITVGTAFSAAITSSSIYQLITGRLYAQIAASATGLGWYDYALGAWTIGKAAFASLGTDAVTLATASLIGAVTESSAGRTWQASTNTTLTVAQGVGTGPAWTTNQWAGSIITITGGTGAAANSTRVVLSNTANTITVDANWGSNPDATTTWVIEHPFAVLKGATTIAGQAYGALSWTNTTNAVLTVASQTTAWTANQWTKCQIRVVSGTGAGQVKAITANTSATTNATLTVNGVFATAPDATSVLVIEGNDDVLWTAGNNAVAIGWYSINGVTGTVNTWTTAGATAARVAAPVAGMGLVWPTNVSDTSWSAQGNIKNGRYLISPRGTGTVIDVYDIALGTWSVALWGGSASSTVTYANNGDAFNTGGSFVYDGQDNMYCMTARGQMLRFDIVRDSLEISANLQQMAQGAALVGDKMFAIPYVDGPTSCVFVYHWRNSGQELFRCPMWATYSTTPYYN